MRDLGLYRDMSENTENYNVFNTKINHYIDYVNELIPDNMRNILSQYNISYGEFCKRFYDFENNKIRKEDLNRFIESFCDRIETIEVMSGILH